MALDLVRVMFILVCFFSLASFFLQLRPGWRIAKVNIREFPYKERGQGLVEYALILVMVAVIVVAALVLLGPTAGNLFSNVVTELSELSLPGITTNPVAGGSVGRTGVDGNDLVVNFEIPGDADALVVVTDSQSGQSKEVACAGSCSVTFTGVGFGPGTITINAGGRITTITYPAR